MNFPTFCTTRYTLGNGSIAALSEYKDGKVALVTDMQIVRALNLEETLFQGIFKDVDFELICDMPKEPTMDLLEEPIRRIKEFEPKYIVAIGGGSVMDTAKALWLFYELPHYDWEKAFTPYAVEKFPGKARLTVIPTTSGTGSETTGCAVIKDLEKRKKMILSNEIMPTQAILDFDLLKSLPPKNIVYSGTDALAHAMEAATSQLASPMVRSVCCEAAVTLIKELTKSLKGDMDARAKVHIAATMAGAGIGNAITGMAHGMDFAGGDFNLPHGLVTGMLLPYTMLFLMPNPFYVEVAERLGISGTAEQKQNGLVDKIFALYDEIYMPLTFAAVGVNEADYIKNIPSYIERAKVDANILFAPKQPSDEELEKLFKEFYYGKEQ